MNRNSTSLQTSCPACSNSGGIDFFSVTRPVDVGRLYATCDEARQAACGDISLRFCTHCGFIFNTAFDPELLQFAPGYEASLDHSPTFAAFTEAVAQRLVQRYDLKSKTIVEIGCGKGTFIARLCELGANVGYGFDPTIEETREFEAGNGRVRLIRDFYDQRYEDIGPDLVCCLSVFEDIQNPAEFLSSLRRLIKGHGRIVYFEVFNGMRALTQQSGWSVHYEQCNYWSLDSLVRIFKKTGFAINEADSCYGDGEYLYVEAMTADEPASSQSESGFEFPRELAGLSEIHRTSVARWNATLRALHEAGQQVTVWGTGGKGISFLSEVPREYVSRVVDINPNRQQRYLAGSGHLIVAPESIASSPPDTIIITNTLYENEIKAQVEALGVQCDFLSI